MNGYEVATHCAPSANAPAAVLIAITGYGQEEDRRRVREAGFDHHLVKPVEPDGARENSRLGHRRRRGRLALRSPTGVVAIRS